MAWWPVSLVLVAVAGGGCGGVLVLVLVLLLGSLNGDPGRTLFTGKSQR